MGRGRKGELGQEGRGRRGGRRHGEVKVRDRAGKEEGGGEPGAGEEERPRGEKKKGKERKEKGEKEKKGKQEKGKGWKGVSAKPKKKERVAAKRQGVGTEKARVNPRVWRLGGLGPVWGTLSILKTISFANQFWQLILENGDDCLGKKFRQFQQK